MVGPRTCCTGPESRRASPTCTRPFRGNSRLSTESWECRATARFRACRNLPACWWRGATRWRWTRHAAGSCASIRIKYLIYTWRRERGRANLRGQYSAVRGIDRLRGHSFQPDFRIPIVSVREWIDATENQSSPDAAARRSEAGASRSCCARSGVAGFTPWFLDCCCCRAIGSRACRRAIFPAISITHGCAVNRKRTYSRAAIVTQTTNILFDLMLAGLFKLLGAEAAQRISVSVTVLVFIWGAFAFAGGGFGTQALASAAVHHDAGLWLGLPHGLLQFLSEPGHLLLGNGAALGAESKADRGGGSASWRWRMWLMPCRWPGWRGYWRYADGGPAFIAARACVPDCRLADGDDAA